MTGAALGRARKGAGGVWVVRSARRELSVRVHGRSLGVTAALLAAGFATFAWSLSSGDFPIPISDVLASLAGVGSEDADFIVRTLRLPRALTGVLVGAAFGVSGAIFQRVARNPLASPDIVGIEAGAAAAAVVTIVVLGGSTAQITVGALAGAVATAVAIYALAYRQGVTGHRLVLVGIGITAALHSVTSFLLTRAEVHDAQRAVVWLTGSLHARGWEHVRPTAVAVVVLVPVALGLGRHLRALELGDDAARGLGTQVERARAALLLIAVALAAVGTGAAGPVAFVALVAPQVARRLVGERGLALLPSAATGALLVVAADLAARRLLSPVELPVGIFTAVLGAPYLLHLLARANRTGTGG